MKGTILQIANDPTQRKQDLLEIGQQLMNENPNASDAYHEGVMDFYNALVKLEQLPEDEEPATQE